MSSEAQIESLPPSGEEAPWHPRVELEKKKRPELEAVLKLV